MARVAERAGTADSASDVSAQNDGTRARAVPEWLIAGGLAGGVASVLFSVVVPPAEMMPMVAALYGLDGVIWGWIFHLLHGVAFGAAFGVLASAARGAGDNAAFLAGVAIVGALYGAVIWLVFAAFVMPSWIGAVTEMNPPVPDWNRLSLLAHVVYGVGVAVVLSSLVGGTAKRGLR